MQTAKAEPIHNGRGWMVQRNVVRLKQQPYTLPDFEKIESFPVQASSTWMKSIIQAEEAVA
jgi:hypothetical protein